MINVYKKNGYSLKIFFSGTSDTVNCGYNIKRIVREAIEKTLFYERFWRDTEVSVTFCNNSYIHKLNKEYRNIDKPTDVLSFPLFEKDELSLADGQAAVPIGDIIISLERAAEQAKEIGNSFEREIAFLAIHSTLHLLGYDHEDAEEEEDMCRRQKDIVATLDI